MKYQARKLYLKNLYLAASQSVMEQNLKCARQYINHGKLVRQFRNVIKTHGKTELCLNDCHSAFFDSLCRKLLQSRYCDSIAVCVMNPCFSTDVLCQVYIPQAEGVFINRFFDKNKCKDADLYTIDLQQKTQHIHLISDKLYEKSKKHSSD